MASNIYLEGTTSCWLKSKVDCMLESIHSPRGPSMYGIHYLLTVCTLVVLICSSTDLDNSCKGGLHF